MKKINLFLCLAVLVACTAWGAMLLPVGTMLGAGMTGGRANVSQADAAADGSKSARATAALPFEFSFSGSGIAGWETLDANGDGITWQVSSYGQGFGICCREAATGLGENDDYLVYTGTFRLEAGKTYEAVLSIGGFNTPGEKNSVELVVGTGDDFKSYKCVGTFALQQEADVPVVFTVDESGDYRIGLHNLCVNSVWYFKGLAVSESDGSTTPDYGPGVMLDTDFTLGEGVMNYGWTVIDGNGDGVQWSFQTGIDGIALTRSMDAAQDDWLVSHPMTLVGGKAYSVEYTIAASGGFEPELVTTAYGTEPVAEAMVNVVGEESVLNDEVTRHYRITPEADGTYYFGFHATSPARNGTIQIKNVTIKESEGCVPLAPTGVTAESDIKKQEVTLAWTNPVEDTEGVAITDLLTTRIVRNGVAVADVPGGKPGATMEYIDRPSPFEGEAKYEVMSYVTEDKPGAATEVTVNLDDFQGDARMQQSWGGTKDGGFNSDWKAVKVSGNNSWMTESYNDTWKINYGKPCDNWLISPAVSLVKNRRYIVKMDIKAGINYPADFELYVGRGDEVADMTELVYNFTAEGNGSVTYTSDQFAVEEDGDYHMGLRVTSVSSQTLLLKYSIYYYENSEVEPEDVPYTENFDGAEPEGWGMPENSSFAFADGMLKSEDTGAARNETVFSPLVNLKAGYTYEVSFDYAFGGGSGSELGFYMSQGQQTTDIIADSRMLLDADGTHARCLFTPEEDGAYCAAWQLSSAEGEGGVVSVDNLAFGVNVYTALPYSENFGGNRINETPMGYAGVTTSSEADGNIVAEVAATGGSTLWFMGNDARDTYNLSFKAQASGNAAWTVSAVSAGGQKREIGTVGGGAAEWADLSFDIPAPGTNLPDTFRIEFASDGTGTLLVDDINMVKNERAVIAGAPYNFRVYKNGIAAWCFPKDEADGNALDANSKVTVDIYEGEELIATKTGAPGEYTYVENLAFVDGWNNDTKLFRAVASIGENAGKTATWVLRMNDDDLFECSRNINEIVGFDFSSDETWSNEGWTIAGSEASVTAAPASLVSPEFELKEGLLYMVRYYIDTDADAGADFTVTVGGASQDFVNAYIGRNTFDWNVGPDHPEYPVGRYQYVDFILPRVEADGTYNVEISVGRVGSRLSVSSVQVFEVREYPEVCEIPYENDFDDPAVPENEIEPNWNTPLYTNPWRIAEMSAYGAEAVSGTRALVAPSTTELSVTNPMDFVYTPYFTLEAGKTYKIEFDYFMPSSVTGLAFVYADEPSYEAYATIDELAQATEWEHYVRELEVTAEGTCVFGFVSYASSTRDNVTAIDNFKITEVTGSSAIDRVEIGDGIGFKDGKLCVPADAKSVEVYNLEGAVVASSSAGEELSLEALARGIYVAKVVCADGTVSTVKFIK